MGFTMEELASYEKQPQTQTDDTTNPFDAKAATEPTQESTSSVEDPVSDPAESGDGTSDAVADSSTATADLDSDADETKEVVAGESATEPPKKNSARERIQELADERDGYREFSRQQTEHSKVLREENARLRALAEGKTTTAAKPSAPPEPLGPMPQLDDPDIDFDPKKLAAKQEAWMDKKISQGIQTGLQQATGKQAVEDIKSTFESRIETFKQTHKDWDLKVRDNPDLIPLHAAALKVVAKSELGPDIIYHLSNNVELEQRIARMDPEDQVAEIGAIRSSLKGKPTVAETSVKPKDPVAGAKPAPKKSVSNAPPPPTPTPAGRRSQERDILDPGLDMGEFVRRHRDERNAARTASRKARGLG